MAPVCQRLPMRTWSGCWPASRGLGSIPADITGPLEHEFRHAVLARLASVPRFPGPKNSTKQRPGHELSGAPLAPGLGTGLADEV